jgi:hypothetical protein
MTPDQMLAEAELVLTDERKLRAVPRAALAAAWTLLAVATQYVNRTAHDERGEADPGLLVGLLGGILLILLGAGLLAAALGVLA